jgi:endo-1,3(4)-beta-glucanase
MSVQFSQRYQYQKIEDLEDRPENYESTVHSLNDLSSTSSSSNSKFLHYSNHLNRYHNVFIFLLVLSLLFLSVAFRLFVYTSGDDTMLGQANLLKSMPYRQINHPDPPTQFWGTVQKPYPTGAFWTNLVIKNGDGAVGVYPYGVKTVEVGVQVSYGSSRRQVSSNAITDIFSVDWQISASQGYISRAVESYDNISVTMSYKTQNNGKYKAILVKGSPFVTVVYDNATPLLSSPAMRITAVDSKLVNGGTGTQYLVTLGNFQKWLVYCSESVILSWKDNSLAAPTPIKGFIRIAVLPNQNVDGAFNSLLTYVQRYPTGGIVTCSYPNTGTAVVTIQYNTVGTGSLLMLALPHHIPLLPPSLVNSDESKAVQSNYLPIWCIKGKMKAIVSDNWKLTYNVVSPGWNYPLTNQLSTPQLDGIAKYLLEEVKQFQPAANDVYSFGKQLGRMTRLALIADNLGIADVRQQAIFYLETSLIPWIQGMNVDNLLYDKIYGGLVTQQSTNDAFSNFGLGWYSDHHFQFGYFVHAVAALVKLDYNFYEANKAGLDCFIRDIANPDPTDLDFPIVRHKDFFDGHSWASGLFQQANGKGQESSSEAVNAYYGVYLYSTALGYNDLMKFSQLLMTMEIQSVQYYWHIANDDIYDIPFSSNRMIGNVGALDVTASTWFGNQVEYVHGINM